MRANSISVFSTSLLSISLPGSMDGLFRSSLRPTLRPTTGQTKASPRECLWLFSGVRIVFLHMSIDIFANHVSRIFPASSAKLALLSSLNYDRQHFRALYVSRKLSSWSHILLTMHSAFVWCPPWTGKLRPGCFIRPQHSGMVWWQSPFGSKYDSAW